VNTIAVSSAEVERALSLMNTIVTKKRANLQIQCTADLMTISLLGQPLELWDPVPYVKSWLRSHHLAEDNRVRNTTEKEPSI
jgi:hypothetical protein